MKFLFPSPLQCFWLLIINITLLDALNGCLCKGVVSPCFCFFISFYLSVYPCKDVDLPSGEKLIF